MQEVTKLKFFESGEQKKWVSQGAVGFGEKAWILLTKSKVSYVNFKVDWIFFFWNILRKRLRDQNVANYPRITFRKLKERSKMPLLFQFQTFVFSNFAHKSDEMVLIGQLILAWKEVTFFSIFFSVFEAVVVGLCTSRAIQHTKDVLS